MRQETGKRRTIAVNDPLYGPLVFYDYGEEQGCFYALGEDRTDLLCTPMSTNGTMEQSEISSVDYHSIDLDIALKAREAHVDLLVHQLKVQEIGARAVYSSGYNKGRADGHIEAAYQRRGQDMGG